MNICYPLGSMNKENKNQTELKSDETDHPKEAWKLVSPLRRASPMGVFEFEILITQRSNTTLIHYNILYYK